MHNIQEIAVKVRKALERVRDEYYDELPKDGTSMFHRFPRACCGDTTIILSQIYKDLGYKNVKYICGSRKEDGTSHAWLKVGDICVDITADQFEEYSFKNVIVCKEQAYPVGQIYESDTEFDYDLDRPHLFLVHCLIFKLIDSL